MRALKCQNTGNNITIFWTRENKNTARSGKTEYSAALAAAVSTLERRPEFPARDNEVLKKKKKSINPALRLAELQLAQSHHCRGTVQVDPGMGPGIAQW